jgi:hypothetical protein
LALGPKQHSLFEKPEPENHTERERRYTSASKDKVSSEEVKSGKRFSVQFSKKEKPEPKLQYTKQITVVETYIKLMFKVLEK